MHFTMSELAGQWKAAADAAACTQGLTACRDGLYTAGYLGVSPVLQQLLAESSALQGASPTTVFVTAGMASGFLAAAVTQPVDTIKTRVQVCLLCVATPVLCRHLCSAQQRAL